MYRQGSSPACIVQFICLKLLFISKNIIRFFKWQTVNNCVILLERKIILNIVKYKEKNIENLFGYVLL
jgi:hypothetical protein